MFPRTLALTAVFAAGLFAPALAQDMVGENAPDAEIKEWVKGNACNSFKDLRGKAILVEFFATWWGPCKGAVKHLNELQEKYGRKGLIVMAASKEAAGTIAPWLEAQEVQYPVFVDDGGATATAYGVRGIPHCALIGPDGKVAFKGHPSSVNDQMLEPVLAKCVLRFGYEFPDEFKKVQTQCEKRDFAGALKSLDGLTEANPEFAQKVRDDIAGYAADARKNAETDAAAGDYLSAMDALAEVAKQFKGTPAGQELDELLKEWKKDPEVKKELAAGKMMMQAKALEKGNNFKAALGVYIGITKKYDGTKTAEAAQKRADAIQSANLWKIDPRCKKCTAARSPCDKHQ